MHPSASRLSKLLIALIATVLLLACASAAQGWPRCLIAVFALVVLLLPCADVVLAPRGAQSASATRSEANLIREFAARVELPPRFVLDAPTKSLDNPLEHPLHPARQKRNIEEALRERGRLPSAAEQLAARDKLAASLVPKFPDRYEAQTSTAHGLRRRVASAADYSQQADPNQVGV
jgi:hypothetical protein